MRRTHCAIASLRNIKVPASGDQLKRRKANSDAPTKEQRIDPAPPEQSGSVSIDVPMAKFGTTQPIPAAVGADVARRVATSPMAQVQSQAPSPMNRPPSMNTMPLGQVSSVPIPSPSTPRGVSAQLTDSSVAGRPSAFSTSPTNPNPGHPSPMSFPSGVVHLQRPATPSEPRLSSLSTPGQVMAPVISPPIVAARAPEKSRAWIVVVIFVVLAAVAGGAALALLHR